MPAKSVLNVLNAMKRIALCSAAMTGLAVTGWAQTTAAPAQETYTPAGGGKGTETRLGPCTREMAFMTLTGMVLINGVSEPTYGPAQFIQAPISPVSSPPGEAVTAKEGRLYPWWSRPGFAHSSDGRHVAYALAEGRFSFTDRCNGSRHCILLDGHAQALPEEPVDRSIAVSPDGKRVAYAIYKNKLLGDVHVVVVDGKAGQEFDEIGVFSVIFSPDGKRLAYSAKRDKQWSVVVDGQVGAGYDGAISGTPIFSPDSKRVAYVTETKGKWSVVVDGQPGAEYAGIWGLRFSPDSRRVAYAARRDKKWSTVVDGQPGAEYEDILGPVFSPDSKRVAYAAMRDKEWSVVADGQAAGEFEEISSLTFSPDSKRLAYAAAKDKRWMVLVDGQVYAKDAGRVGGRGYPSFYSENHNIKWSPKVNFSPDGKRMLYTSLLDKGFSVVVDGKAGPEFDDLGFPVFSPDGNHVAYVAATPGLGHISLPTAKIWLWSMIVDGHVVAGTWSIILGDSPTFSPDAALEFLGMRPAVGHNDYCDLYDVKYTPADWHSPKTEPEAQPNNPPAVAPAASPVHAPGAQVSLIIDSTPTGADIEVDGAFVGNTPSTIGVAPGKHQIAIKMKGFTDWTRTMAITGGTIHLSAELEKAAQ
jgi:Tol biopolymer transport system component